jgi:hypothetical protein
VRKLRRKWDGIRLITEKRGNAVKLWSRNGIDVTARYAVLLPALQKIEGSCVLDALGDHAFLVRPLSFGELTLSKLSDMVAVAQQRIARQESFRREVDIPLRDTLEAADGREGAAVTNRRDDKLIEHRSVRDPIDSLREVSTNPRRNIIAPSNDNIGAKRRNQLFVFLRRIGDDR